MNEENKVLTPNETPETTVEDTKETALLRLQTTKRTIRARKISPKRKRAALRLFLSQERHVTALWQL